MPVGRFGCAAALLVVLSGCGVAPATDDTYPTARVSVGMHVVEAEVADTPARKTRGLSGRTRLAEGQGLLFPYAYEDLHGFWMFDMHFDIDIVWIRGDRIVDVTHGAVHDPPGELPIYRPSEPADLVLEVPAGTAARLGWRPGDPVRVEPPIPGEWKAS